MQRAAHPDGECAAARACAAHSVPYCASQQSTTAIEEIGRAGGDGPKMFQLYVLSDRDATAKLIRRAETMGATAMCITVDAPVLGRRERDVRNRFKLKAGLKLVNVENAKNEKNAKNADNQTKSAVDAKRAQSAIARRIGGRDASLSWDHLVWLRTVTKLPIVLKGICTYADAKLATQAGVAAVWVSNHGGRQLDGSAATLDALPEVVAGVAGACPVIFDGGVRRGSDVLKALALGADLVAVGRPCAWGHMRPSALLCVLSFVLVLTTIATRSLPDKKKDRRRASRAPTSPRSGTSGPAAAARSSSGAAPWWRYRSSASTTRPAFCAVAAARRSPATRGKNKRTATSSVKIAGCRSTRRRALCVAPKSTATASGPKHRTGASATGIRPANRPRKRRRRKNEWGPRPSSMCTKRPARYQRSHNIIYKQLGSSRPPARRGDLVQREGPVPLDEAAVAL